MNENQKNILCALGFFMGFELFAWVIAVGLSGEKMSFVDCLWKQVEFIFSLRLW